MDTFEQNLSQNLPIDKFKFGKKWFWLGIVIAVLNSVAGLIYGVSLAIEKEHRKEGLIIAVWAIAWALIVFFIISPYIIMPRLQMAK